MNKSFTDIELKLLSDLQNNFAELIKKMGQNAISEIEVRKEKLALENEYETLKTQESILLDQITNKYGTGTLNLDSGIFISET